MIGQTISHYQIQDKLGQGGMGIVYKALDTRLDRTVALKFLSTSALPTDDDKARFYREAKAAAKLNHPHIATVYAIDETEPAPGEPGGQAFIAMEYVEGETLAEKIKRGPLKLQEAITIATQIAEGLQAAHERGVVHRDVKSSNVMLDEQGQVKIMDFGLAMTTASTRLTRTGSTMGTVAYMSPEQARGEAVDHRTDLWSLGVVLYEMISGRLPFAGDYEQAVVYGILNEDPEALTGLRTGVPMALERVVMKCLSKDASQRYQHADEVAVDLRTIDPNTGSGSTITKVAEVPRRARWKQTLPWSLLALMTVVAVMLSWRSMQPATPPSVERWNLNLPEHAPLALVGAAQAGVGMPALAFSPDGTHLVYVAEHEDGTTQLYRRAMDQRQATPMPGTEGAHFPFFSPDGNSVGFFAAGRLKTVSLQGGTPISLCEVSVAWGATWTSDDQIVFVDKDGTSLSWVEASGGDVRRLPSSLERQLYWPTSLPGGEDVLVSTYQHLAVVSLQTGRMKRLVIQGVGGSISNPTYMPTGHVLFGLPGRLMAVPFDLHRREVTSPPVTVVDQVRTEILLGAVQFAASGDGKLAYVPGHNASTGELVLIDEQGREEPLGFVPKHYGPFQLSPDGRRLAVAVLDDKWDVWIYDLERASPQRLTVEGNNMSPVWALDGESVAFSSDRHGPFNLYWKPADGAGGPERLTTSENSQFPHSFAPDGQLAFSELDDSTSGDVWLLSMEDGRTAEPLIRTPNWEVFPRFSPDGRYMAYTSDEEGRPEVYVQTYPEGKERKKVSVGGGEKAVWSPAGDALFYLHPNGYQWMIVPIEPEPAFRGVPRVFVEGPYLGVFNFGHDVAPDGRRLLLIKGDGVRTAERLNVNVNWFEELGRLVPTDGLP